MATQINRLLVVTDYEALDASDVYLDPETRMRNGVLVNPVAMFDETTQQTVYCLPPEWAPELDKEGLAYTIQDITTTIEE